MSAAGKGARLEGAEKMKAAQLVEMVPSSEAETRNDLVVGPKIEAEALENIEVMD